MYVMEHYNDAFMPTSFIDKEGKMLDIAQLEKRPEAGDNTIMTG